MTFIINYDAPEYHNYKHRFSSSVKTLPKYKNDRVTVEILNTKDFSR